MLSLNRLKCVVSPLKMKSKSAEITGNNIVDCSIPGFSGNFTLEGLEKIKQLVGLLYRNGVRLGVGSDAPNPWTIPGTSLIREMELMVECGIPAMKVIQLATKNAAVALGKSFQDTGSIKEGNAADLIILRENPAIDIASCRKIAHVIRRGLLHILA